MTAYCGLDCKKCPVHLAYKSNNTEQRLKVAQEWTEKYSQYVNKELVIDDIICDGCKSENIFLGCLTCPMRKCAKVRNENLCFECIDFDKCNYINKFLEETEEGKIQYQKFLAKIIDNL